MSIYDYYIISSSLPLWILNLRYKCFLFVFNMIAVIIAGYECLKFSCLEIWLNCYIMLVSYIERGNQNIWRKPPTNLKWLTNLQFIPRVLLTDKKDNIGCYIRNWNNTLTSHKEINNKMSRHFDNYIANYKEILFVNMNIAFMRI